MPFWIPLGQGDEYMFKFFMASMVLALMPLAVSAQQTNDAKQIAELREKLTRVGRGRDVVVTVTRRDGTKLKGYVKEIRDDGFDIVSMESGSSPAPITITYREVLKIVGKGINWKGGATKAGLIGLKTFKVMTVLLKGVNPQFPP